MFKNYTKEPFVNPQKDMAFMLEHQQEVVRIITKNLGEDMGQFAQSNFLSILLFYGGDSFGVKHPDMPRSEVKEFVAKAGPKFHGMIEKTISRQLKEFEEKYEAYMQIFEQGIYYGQCGEEEGV